MRAAGKAHERGESVDSSSECNAARGDAASRKYATNFQNRTLDVPTLIHRRVRECRAGSNAKLICRVRAGWVVLGDVQFLRGYSLLLPDPVVPDLNALDESARRDFLLTLAVIGDVLLEATGALRINYEILGNQEPALHGHVFPRYADEPADLRTRPPWFYDWANAPAFDRERDRAIMQTLADGLRKRGLAL